MKSARQRGREHGGRDIVAEFVSPNRASAVRSAKHRFIEADATGRESSGEARFTADEFKPRWWPAPDATE